MEAQLPLCGSTLWNGRWCCGSCMGWCVCAAQRAEKAGVGTMAVPVAET